LQCWQGAHWAFALLSFAGLLLVFCVSVFRALAPDYTGAPGLLYIPRFDVFVTCGKLALCAATVFWDTRSALALAVAIGVLTLFAAAGFWWQPCLGNSAQHNTVRLFASCIKRGQLFVVGVLLNRSCVAGWCVD
jgi:hypothetical protein